MNRSDTNKFTTPWKINRLSKASSTNRRGSSRTWQNNCNIFKNMHIVYKQILILHILIEIEKLRGRKCLPSGPKSAAFTLVLVVGSWLLGTLRVSMIRSIILHGVWNWWWNNIRTLIVSLNWCRIRLRRRICLGWRWRVWSGWWWIYSWNLISTPKLITKQLN